MTEAQCPGAPLCYHLDLLQQQRILDSFLFETPLPELFLCLTAVIMSL